MRYKTVSIRPRRSAATADGGFHAGNRSAAPGVTPKLTPADPVDAAIELLVAALSKRHKERIRNILRARYPDETPS